jgi:hypothetical protein
MDPFDDYQDEMSGRLTSERAEAILAGRARADDDPLGATLGRAFDELRRELFDQPGPEVAARHLAAMVAASESASALDRTARMARKWRPFPRLRLAIVGLAVCLVLFGGLAIAGALPGPVQDVVADAAAVVGLDLPGGAPEAAGHGKEVSETARNDELSGCEKGMAVAEVATSKAAEDPDLPENACTEGDERSGSKRAGAGSGSGSGGRTDTGGAGAGGAAGGADQGFGGGSGSGGGGSGSGSGSGGGSGSRGSGSGGGASTELPDAPDAAAPSR